MSKNRYFLFSTFLLIILLNPCNASSGIFDRDSLILATISKGDLENLRTLLTDPADINKKYGKNGQTLITYAIESGQLEVTEFLIEKGADLETIYEGKTPLMFASRYGEAEIARVLLNSGADINTTNGDRNTGFHYAAKYNNLDLLKILYESGARINIPNNDSWTALDYSIINGEKEIEDYLRSIGCILFKKKIPDYFDGPYIEFKDKTILEIKYLANVQGRRGSYIHSEERSFSNESFILKGSKGDRSNYFITTEPKVPASLYKEPSRIFAIGDIHGQYDRMVEMLQSGGVIDKENNWIWGDGHLVFMGDILDRGDGVMEALWLINKLENQAEEYNGKVHFLLGNHEVMIIKNDIRYISNKYYCLTSNLNLKYSDLFSERTILGKWLRTKNVVEVIGETMFIHAGISPELFRNELSLEEINNEFRKYLSLNSNEKLSEMALLLKGNYGPIWYRGYLKAGSGYKEIENNDLSNILKYYSAKRVVVGHTEVDLIEPQKSGLVIPINIPLANKEIIGQGLLIETNNFFRIATDNSKTKLITK